MIAFFAKAALLIALVLLVTPFVFIAIIQLFGKYFKFKIAPDSIAVRIKERLAKRSKKL